MVDDDSTVLRALENLLESADYTVRLFASATALLESGCLAEIDALISDIDMPRMDGFELLRLARSARPRLPIVLITGYPETLQPLPAPAGSNLRFFTKPVQGENLLSSLSDALRVSGAR